MPNFFLSHKRVKVAAPMPGRQGDHRNRRPGFEANAPRSGPSSAGFNREVAAGKRAKTLWAFGITGAIAMKLFTGWVISAGLIFTAVAANAQGLTPYEINAPRYTTASDVVGPYAAAVPEAPGPGYGPTLMPVQEVYTVVRESGFSPLGIPRQRGLVYTISVIDRGGDDGRLVIDARTGRILRFVPAYRMGANFEEEMTVGYGPVGPLPPVASVRGPPRPPASVPRVASRAPLPKASPQARSAPEPAQQSATVQAKPAEMRPATPAPAPAIVEAKPAVPQIQPTQDMPKVQGLD
jgi:hypothetical protein